MLKLELSLLHLAANCLWGHDMRHSVCVLQLQGLLCGTLNSHKHLKVPSPPRMQVCPTEGMVDEAADALIQRGKQLQAIFEQYAAGQTLTSLIRTINHKTDGTCPKIPHIVPLNHRECTQVGSHGS
jgi:hypothetical protein